MQRTVDKSEFLLKIFEKKIKLSDLLFLLFISEFSIKINMIILK